MAERRAARTAEERLAERRSDLASLRRKRLLREVAGPRWRRMVSVTPALFERQGTFAVRRLLAPRDAVVDAIKQDALFASDTALRLARGTGFLAGGDVHVYLTSPEPIERVARAGLVAAEPFADDVLVRPWPGPPRLLASIVAELPPERVLGSGHRVVTMERLRRELIGAVGARADLFALVEGDD